MNKLLKYLADRDLQNQVQNTMDEVKKRFADGNWAQKKSESFTAKFKEELACIIDAGISFSFNTQLKDVLLITFQCKGGTLRVDYVSDDNWSPDWKAYGFSDWPTHYLLDVVGDWYKSLLPAPVKKDPVILFVSFHEDIYKGQAAQVFNVECPFQSDELCSSDMAKFKYKILDAFNLIGYNATANFDFDIADSFGFK